MFQSAVLTMLVSSTSTVVGWYYVCILFDFQPAHRCYLRCFGLDLTSHTRVIFECAFLASSCVLWWRDRTRGGDQKESLQPFQFLQRSVAVIVHVYFRTNALFEMQNEETAISILVECSFAETALKYHKLIKGIQHGFICTVFSILTNYSNYYT